MLAVAQHGDTVDQDVDHARRILVGSGEGGVVLDGGGVEDGEVGVVAGKKAASAVEVKVGGGKGGQAADRFRQRGQARVAHVVAEEPGEGAVGARVRVEGEKDAFG